MSEHQVRFGEAGEVLATLDADSVDCCITSPPYWGLRDYGGWRMYAAWHPKGEWEFTETFAFAFPSGRRTRKRGAMRRDIDLRVRASLHGGLECPATGVRIDALGLEPTPDLYVTHLVQIMAEVRRVLEVPCPPTAQTVMALDIEGERE